MPINQVNLTILFTLILLVTAHVTLAQGKKLKPEEAAKAVQLVHALETDPLSENAKKSRDWLTKTVFGADGLYVPQCKDLFDRADSKGKYAKALTLQVSVSFAAYTIEYPTDSAEDPETRMRAGVEGMLKAYDSILVSEPKRQNGTDCLGRLWHDAHPFHFLIGRPRNSLCANRSVDTCQSQE